MLKKRIAKDAPCRKCPHCGDPLVDLDYVCRKCGAICKPKPAMGVPDHGTTE